MAFLLDAGRLTGFAGAFGAAGGGRAAAVALSLALAPVLDSPTLGTVGCQPLAFRLEESDGACVERGRLEAD